MREHDPIVEPLFAALQREEPAGEECEAPCAAARPGRARVLAGILAGVLALAAAACWMWFF